MATNRPTISEFRRRTATRLRETPTAAENLLWRHLRRFPISGTHFRCQVPIGPYVADFACMAARLIIEVDGSQHGHDGIRQRDDRRTRWLEAEGYRVLRFWNNDLTNNIDGVLEAIYAVVHGSNSAEPAPLKHRRHTGVLARGERATPPRRAARADPPPAGEGEGRP
jgi:very-short-patch-repair endonuclease